MAQGARRGRLPAAERAARRDEILDAAEAALVESGAEGTTMLDVARRAGASKETLYRWFGDRDGLFGAIVERNAGEAAAAVERLLDGDDPRDVLTAFAVALLRLLTGPRSVALNRAAMASPELAAVVLRGGRHTIGPLVEERLAALAARGVLDVPDPADAFRVLYGLVVRDAQIRVLLGEDPPSDAAIRDAATAAVDQFLRLFGGEALPPPSAGHR